MLETKPVLQVSFKIIAEKDFLNKMTYNDFDFTLNEFEKWHAFSKQNIFSVIFSSNLPEIYMPK